MTVENSSTIQWVTTTDIALGPYPHHHWLGSPATQMVVLIPRAHEDDPGPHYAEHYWRQILLDLHKDTTQKTNNPAILLVTNQS